jgi:hypothetical protein
MSWSKQDLVTKAFGQIGLNYTFDVQPEEIQDGLSTMDAMMADWNAEGIRLGYAMSSTMIVDGSVDSGLPDTCYIAVFTNLAMILASGLGRQVSQTLTTTAKRTYNNLLAKAASAPPVRLPCNMPAGAGHKGWRGWDRVFVNQKPTDIQAGGDGPLEFNAGGCKVSYDPEGQGT